MVGCGSGDWIEWTYEGRRKESASMTRRRVATDGISARYKGSTYEAVREKMGISCIFPGGIAKAALLSRSLDRSAFLLCHVRIGDIRDKKGERQ